MIASISADEEAQAAERVYRRVLATVPVGTHRRSYRPTYRDVLGRTRHMKAWMQRIPGRLRSTVRKAKSKYEGGGFVVLVGSALAYYAKIVEYGTRMRRQKTTGRYTGRAKAVRYMRRAINAEKTRFWRMVREKLRAKIRG